MKLIIAVKKGPPFVLNRCLTFSSRANGQFVKADFRFAAEFRAGNHRKDEELKAATNRGGCSVFHG
jgi:hypothetical protein